MTELLFFCFFHHFLVKRTLTESIIISRLILDSVKNNKNVITSYTPCKSKIHCLPNHSHILLPFTKRYTQGQTPLLWKYSDQEGIWEQSPWLGKYGSCQVREAFALYNDIFMHSRWGFIHLFVHLKISQSICDQTLEWSFPFLHFLHHVRYDSWLIKKNICYK